MNRNREGKELGTVDVCWLPKEVELRFPLSMSESGEVAYATYVRKDIADNAQNSPADEEHANALRRIEQLEREIDVMRDKIRWLDGRVLELGRWRP